MRVYVWGGGESAYVCVEEADSARARRWLDNIPFSCLFGLPRRCAMATEAAGIYKDRKGGGVLGGKVEEGRATGPWVLLRERGASGLGYSIPSLLPSFLLFGGRRCGSWDECGSWSRRSGTHSSSFTRRWRSTTFRAWGTRRTGGRELSDGRAS